MDFSGMFNSDPTALPMLADPRQAVNMPGANTGTDWSGMLNNPAVQMTALNVAKALDPNGPGGRLATGMAPMVQGKALAPTLSAQQPKQVNPLDKAKELSNASSLLKKAAEINPNVVPGFGDMMTKAVNMSPIGAAFAEKPELMPNPTEPIGDTFAEQTPVGASTNAQPFNYTMNPDTAAALGPDLVKDSFKYGLDVQKQINENLLTPAHAAALATEAKFKNWQMEPARVEEHIKMSIAPVLAQLDVYKGKQALTKESIGAVLKANPGLAAMQLPGGGTVAQWAELNAADPEGAKNISNIIAQGMHYNALKYSADMHYKGAQATAATNNSLKEFQVYTTLYEKANADIAKWEAAPTAEAWAKMSELDRMGAAAKGITGPRTPGMIEAINKAKITRDSIGTKLYGPAYAELSKMEKEFGSGALKADPAKLKEIESAMSTTTNPEILQNMVDIFANPTQGTWRGI